MKKFIIFVFFIVSIHAQTFAQAKSYADVSLAAGKNLFSGALSYYRLHPVAFGGKFSVGYGLRYTGSTAGTQAYVTAPAEVSEGNFFKKQNEAKLDTLTLNAGQINSINAAIYLAYQLHPKWAIGFNIDAIGASWGSPQTGSLQSYGVKTAESATVSPFNILLTGDNDKGSLNSEAYLAYSLTPHLLLRGGASFLFSEYTTNRKITTNFDNDKFRFKSLSPMLALSYQF